MCDGATAPRRGVTRAAAAAAAADDMKAFADNSISEIVLLGGNYEKIRVTDW